MEKKKGKEKKKKNFSGLPFSWERKKLQSELLFSESFLFPVTPVLGPTTTAVLDPPEAQSQIINTWSSGAGSLADPCHCITKRNAMLGPLRAV